MHFFVFAIVLSVLVLTLDGKATTSTERMVRIRSSRESEGINLRREPSRLPDANNPDVYTEYIDGIPVVDHPMTRKDELEFLWFVAKKTVRQRSSRDNLFRVLNFIRRSLGVGFRILGNLLWHFFKKLFNRGPATPS